MGVKVTKREYFNQFYQRSQSTDWLIGNVGDWVRLELTFEAAVDFEGSPTDTIFIDEELEKIKLNNGRDWQSYGFDIGDEITIIFDDVVDGNVTPQTHYRNIQNILGDTIETANPSLTNLGEFTIIPSDRGQRSIKNLKIFTEKEPQGLKLRYSHITNDDVESNTLRSFIDGSVTEFSFAGLDVLPIGVDTDMNPDGYQSGMSINEATIRKVGTSTGADQTERDFRFNTTSFNVDFVRDGRAFYALGGVDSPGTGDTRTREFVGTPNSTHPHIPFKSVTNERVFRVTNTIDVLINGSNQGAIFLEAMVYRNYSNYTFDRYVRLRTVGDTSELRDNLLSGETNDIFSLVLGPGESAAIGYTSSDTNQWFTNIRSRMNIGPSVISLFNDDFGDIGFTYRASIVFMISSLFEDQSDLDEPLNPPSQVFNSASLTDNFSIDVFPEWNNPNTIITNDLEDTQRLGNTGWFNENFNGLDNNYKVESVKYEDIDGGQLGQLDYEGETVLKARINGFSNINENSAFFLGFAWIPNNEEDFKNLETPFHDNILNDNIKVVSSSSRLPLPIRIDQIEEPIDASVLDLHLNSEKPSVIFRINDVAIYKQVNDNLSVEARITPNPRFTEFFSNREEEDRNYIIWLSVASPTTDLRINFSDRVTLLLDKNVLRREVAIKDSFDGISHRFLQHPNIEFDRGTRSLAAYIEDDITNVLDIVIPSGKKLENIVFGYEAYNSEIDRSYSLEEYSANTSLFPLDSSGVQQIDLKESRGFKHPINNRRNDVVVRTKEFSDSQYSVEAFFNTKIRWEDWIERNGVPDEYFDLDDLNNGSNNKWFDYQEENSVIRFFVITTFSENGELERFKNTFEIRLLDYDSNNNIDSQFFYYRDSDDTLLNTAPNEGVILSNENTRIEVIHTKLDGEFDIGLLYGIIGIETFQGSGRPDFYQISTEYSPSTQNPLKPLNNEVQLKVEQLSLNQVKFTALIDPDNLERVLNYKLSSRIGCYLERGLNNRGIYEDKYSNKYE